MAEDANFYGGVKEVSTKFGQMFNVGFSEKDLNEMLGQLNERGYFNLTMARSQKGNWYMKENTYKPSNEKPVNAGSSDDLPY